MRKAELYDKAHELSVEAERLSRIASELAESGGFDHPQAVALRKQVHQLYIDMERIYSMIDGLNSGGAQ